MRAFVPRVAALVLVAATLVAAGGRGPGPIQPLQNRGPGPAETSKDAVVQEALRAYQSGMGRTGGIELRAALSAYPDAHYVQSLYASFLSRKHYYADAAYAFRFGTYGSWYERESQAYHADALRQVGHVDEAVALREELLHKAIGTPLALTVAIDLADDHRMAGEYAEAEAALWSVIGDFPRSSALHAVLAETYYEMGRVDDGEFHYWMSTRNHRTISMRARILEVRLQVSAGELEDAMISIKKVRKLRKGNKDIAALHAELYRQMGEPEAALALLSMDRWNHNENPHIVAVRIRALWDVGQHLDAEFHLRRAIAVYPSHPDILDAKAHMETR